MPDGLFWKMGVLQTPSHLDWKFYYRVCPAQVFPFTQFPRRTSGDLEILGTRTKRSLKVGGNQRWGEEEWPPQRIIENYGPTTWAQDESWGFQTPIYMLNQIIRLQAVVEIITNQTASALELLARQQTQMRAALYQNHLV
jgi:hypothetical protein